MVHNLPTIDRPALKVDRAVPGTVRRRQKSVQDTGQATTPEKAEWTVSTLGEILTLNRLSK